MSSLIDLEIYVDQINENTPKDNFTEFTDIDLPFDSEYGRAAKKFVKNSSPTVFFVCEYLTKTTGCCICFEKHYNASHYEIFRRNVFSKNQEFERILVLSAEALEKETKLHLQYVKHFLKFEPRNCYIVLDGMYQVKQDRIYEYKIRANYYPKSANIDYTYLADNLNVKQIIGIDNTNRDKIINSILPIDAFRGFPHRYINDNDWYWVFCLLNDKCSFFTKFAGLTKIDEIKNEENRVISIAQSSIYDNNVFYLMIRESFKVFGIKPTLINLFKLLTKNDQQNNVLQEILSLSLNYVNETTKTFDYMSFMSSLTGKFPNSLFVYKKSGLSIEFLLDRAVTTRLSDSQLIVQSKKVASLIKSYWDNFQHAQMDKSKGFENYIKEKNLGLYNFSYKQEEVIVEYGTSNIINNVTTEKVNSIKTFMGPYLYFHPSRSPQLDLDGFLMTTNVSINLMNIYEFNGFLLLLKEIFNEAINPVNNIDRIDLIN